MIIQRNNEPTQGCFSEVFQVNRWCHRSCMRPKRVETEEASIRGDKSQSGLQPNAFPRLNPQSFKEIKMAMEHPIKVVS